jgi:hypothetical protein
VNTPVMSTGCVWRVILISASAFTSLPSTSIDFDSKVSSGAFSASKKSGL